MPVEDTADIENFFDRSAADYREQHGPAERLLGYRLELIRTMMRFRPDDAVLEIGCGPGNHLLPLAGLFASALGTDLSPAMVDIATRRCRGQRLEAKVQFRVANAEMLPGVAPGSFDAAFCVGAFEHMVDKPAVLRNIARALKPGGRFGCLTPNADWVWYRRLAPLLRLETTRLSTDRFVNAAEVKEMLRVAGFEALCLDPWTFVPCGDMPAPWGRVMDALDVAGRWTGIGALRGGLAFHAVRRSDAAS